MSSSKKKKAEPATREPTTNTLSGSGAAQPHYATDIYAGRPLAVDVGIGRKRFYVELADGRTLSIPYSAYERLANGTAAERGVWSLIGRGGGIHWEQLDEDVSVGGLVRDYGATATLVSEAA